MPRFTATSSAVVKPAGGMMPSISAAVRPASAIAVRAASSIELDGQAFGTAHVVGLADPDDRRLPAEGHLAIVTRTS